MTLSPTTARHRKVSARLPARRALLEDLWRQQVADIGALPYDALTPTEEGDASTRAEDLHVTAQLIAAARQQLEETGAALACVGAGAYGRCGNCQTPIAAERLDALPTARYCLSCQTGRPRSQP